MYKEIMLRCVCFIIINTNVHKLWVHYYQNRTTQISTIPILKKMFKGQQLKKKFIYSLIKNRYLVLINIYKVYFISCKTLNIFCDMAKISFKV